MDNKESFQQKLEAMKNQGKMIGVMGMMPMHGMPKKTIEETENNPNIETNINIEKTEQSSIKK